MQFHNRKIQNQKRLRQQIDDKTMVGRKQEICRGREGVKIVLDDIFPNYMRATGSYRNDVMLGRGYRWG